MALAVDAAIVNLQVPHSPSTHSPSKFFELESHLLPPPPPHPSSSSSPANPPSPPPPFQEYTLRKYDASHDELVLYSYGLGSTVLLLSALLSGELSEGLSFLHRSPTSTSCLLIFYCTCGYLGVTCVAALTKKFGALASTITTTARKALTLFLSFFLFPKPATPMHVLGGLLFVCGLSVKTVPSATLQLCTDQIIQAYCRVCALGKRRGHRGGIHRNSGDEPNTPGSTHMGGDRRQLVI